jgi:tRNA pseudouridine-54 N-methylase
MQVIFFVKSATVDIDKFNIKDIPGSSRRLDVISRCILSALVGEKGLEKNFQIWIFLDKYGTFIFDSNTFNENDFPISEIKLSNYFVDLILDKKENRKRKVNPLNPVKYIHSSFFEEVKDFKKKGYKIIVLNEEGDYFHNNFLNLSIEDNLLFIVGDQTGEIVNINELKDLAAVNMSLGKKSYLASSVIRLIKFNLNLIIS